MNRWRQAVYGVGAPAGLGGAWLTADVSSGYAFERTDRAVR
ncbi:hypothetical protein [Nonomuraea sp. GTA35]